MYPSDYGYATSDNCNDHNLYVWHNYSACYMNDWLYTSKNNWTITSNAYKTTTTSSFGYGKRVSSSDVYDLYDVRPVVYLKSSVKLSSGIGSKDDPYILSES